MGDSAFAEACHRPFGNGTEGHAWMDKWCSHCARDHAMHMERGDDGEWHECGDPADACGLVLTSMCGEWPEGWINTSNGVDSPDGAHYATYPLELIRRPVLASCPPGGTILDPFGGSGSTAIAAALHGRNAVLIDLDPNNVAIALRLVAEHTDGHVTTWTVEAPLPNQRAQAEGQRSLFEEVGFAL